MSLHSVLDKKRFYSATRLHRLVKPYFFDLGEKKFRLALQGKLWDGINTKCKYMRHPGVNSTFRIKGEDFIDFYKSVEKNFDL